MSILIIICILWEVYWKAHALWIAARNNDKTYFIAILVINSLGVLPIYYLYKNGFFKN